MRLLCQGQRISLPLDATCEHHPSLSCRAVPELPVNPTITYPTYLLREISTCYYMSVSSKEMTREMEEGSLKLKKEKEREHGRRKDKGKGGRKMKGIIVGRYSKITSGAFHFIPFCLEMREALYNALKFSMFQAFVPLHVAPEAGLVHLRPEALVD
jgi:hypothetical protein